MARRFSYKPPAAGRASLTPLAPAPPPVSAYRSSVREEEDGGGFFDPLVGAGKAILGGVDTVLSGLQRGTFGTIADLKRGDIGAALNPIEDLDDEENKPSEVLGIGGIGGLAADILLDPINFTGVGLVAKAAKGGVRGVDAISDAARGAGEVRTLTGGSDEIIKRREALLQRAQKSSGRERKRTRKELREVDRQIKAAENLRDMDPAAIERFNVAKDLAARELAGDARDAVRAQVSFGIPFTDLRHTFEFGPTIEKGVLDRAAQAGGVAGLAGGKARDVRNAFGKGFNPKHGREAREYEANRYFEYAGRAQAAEREQRLSKAIDAAKASASQDDLNRVASVLERAQGIKNVDITNPETWKNAAKGDRKIVEELAREWEALPEGAKQVASELRGFYDYALNLGRAAGLRHGEIPGYISQVAREAPGAFSKKGLDAAKKRSNLITDPSFTRHRRGEMPEGLSFDELVESALIHNRAVHRAAGGREYMNLLRKQQGRQFSNPKAAQAAGFKRFDSEQMNKALGENTYLPAKLVDSIEAKPGAWEGADAELNPFLAPFSSATAKVKNLMYSSNPGRMFIDTVGDMANTLGDGISIRPGDVKLADEMTKYLRGDIKDKAVKIDGKEVKLSELARASEAGAIRATGASVGRSGMHEGGRLTTGIADDVRLRDIPKKAASKAKREKRPFAAWSDAVQTVGNRRDNINRGAAFAAAVRQEIRRGADPGEAINTALRRTRANLFDYSELTPLEQAIRNTGVPFYTWTRKNLPLQAKRLAERPGSIATPFKVQEFMNEQGPEEGLLPEYIRESSFFIPEGTPLIGGDENTPQFLNPMLPQFDVGRFQTYRAEDDPGLTPLGLDGGEALGMINPMIKLPVEIASNHDFYRNEEIDNKGEHIARSLGGQWAGQLYRQMDPGSTSRERITGAMRQFLGPRIYGVDLESAQIGAQIRLRDIKRRLRQRVRDEAEDEGYLIEPLGLGNPFAETE